MAYDRLVDSAKLDAEMKATADAIREKSKSKDGIPWKDGEGFAGAVSAIRAGELDAFVTRDLEAYESDTVTYIGNSAFRDCKKLASVKIPNLKSVDYYAFRECDALTEIDFPMLTEMVGAYPFVKCHALVRVNLPLVTNLSQGAFDECSVLAEISCPNVESTGAYAFRGSKLTEIDLPNATDISMGMFEQNTNLARVNIPLAKSVGTYAFNLCSALQSLALPLCESVGENAMFGCSSLSDISLPKCKTIDAKAFRGCSNLQSVDLSSVETIGENAFLDCSLLQSLALPLCESVGEGAMHGCSSLSDVSLPKCKTIGSTVFKGCSNLQRADLSGAEVIGEKAFHQFSNLTDVVFPADLPSIGEAAFANCKVRGTLSYDGNTAKNNITIGTDAFRRCSIEKIAFNGRIEDGGITLGAYCFADNTSLTEASLGDVVSVPMGTFEGCAALEIVDIGTLSDIGQYAFNKCTALKSLIIRGSSVARLEAVNAFQNCSVWIRICVPSDLVDAYKAAENWSSIAHRIFALEEYPGTLNE